MAAGLAGALDQLDLTEQDKRQARDALLSLLASFQPGHWGDDRLVEGVVQLATTAEDKRQTRDALLSLLDGQTDGRTAAELADGVVRLDPTVLDKRQAREALLSLLDPAKTDSWTAGLLVNRIAQLDPTVRDLTTCHDWAAPPTVELLSAMRQNVALAAWLASLPLLASLPEPPRRVKGPFI